MKSERLLLTAATGLLTAAILLSGCAEPAPAPTETTMEPTETVTEVTDHTENTEPAETVSAETTTPIIRDPELDLTVPAETFKAAQLRVHGAKGEWWRGFLTSGDNYLFTASSAEELLAGLEKRNMAELDVSQYDEAFFAENRLALIPRASSSGSVRYAYSLTDTANGVEITLYAQTPQIGTADMADWLVAVPVPLSVYGPESVITVNPAGASFLSNATLK